MSWSSARVRRERALPPRTGSRTERRISSSMSLERMTWRLTTATTRSSTTGEAAAEDWASTETEARQDEKDRQEGAIPIRAATICLRRTRAGLALSDFGGARDGSSGLDAHAHQKLCPRLKKKLKCVASPTCGLLIRIGERVVDVDRVDGRIEVVAEIQADGPDRSMVAQADSGCMREVVEAADSLMAGGGDGAVGGTAWAGGILTCAEAVRVPCTYRDWAG